MLPADSKHVVDTGMQVERDTSVDVVAAEVSPCRDDDLADSQNADDDAGEDADPGLQSCMD